MIRVADYIMNFLADRGVRDVFLLVGGGAMHLDDALGRNSRLRYTCFEHEQALAIAVEAVGQHTNSPGVGLVTSGPGATNTITAVAAAWIDSTPAFFLSGQAKRPDLKKGSGVRQMGSQEVDIVSMVGCITKYAVTVMEPAAIRYHLERAWHEATHGRKGPVWLDIPLDVQGALVDETVMKGFVPPAGANPPFPAEKIAEALAGSKRPLLLVGNGVKLAGVSDPVRAFAEKYSIPVIMSWKTADFMGFDHPLNFGFPGIMGGRCANFIVQNCDCLLVLGSRLDPSITAFNSADFARNAFKIMVDIDPAEIRKIKGISLACAADLARAVPELVSAPFSMKDHEPWLEYCRSLKAKYPAFTGNDGGENARVDLYRFTDELFHQLLPSDVVVPESSGAAGEITYQAMRVRFGQSIKNAAGLGSMGFGLPYAVGSCIAMDRRRTVLVNGDGAFQLNIQELETLHRLNLPVKIFLWDNGGYRSIVNTQNNMFGGFTVGSTPESGYTTPDTAAVAAAYGLRTFLIRSNGEIRAGIAETLAAPGPVLCRVMVRLDHKTIPKVQAMKLPDGGMVSKPLEDMWPYLPQSEVEENMRISKS